MNIPTPDHAQAWRDGHADGLEGRRDEARYSRDDDDARCYRDGHRMARRQVADGVAAAPDEKPWPAVGTPEAAKVNDAMHAATFDKEDPTKEVEAMKYFDELDKMVTRHFSLPAHVVNPSAFSDPIPGKKAKRAKPADPTQTSLF